MKKLYFIISLKRKKNTYFSHNSNKQQYLFDCDEISHFIKGIEYFN